MLIRPIQRLSSAVVLGILLMPSPRIFGDKRTHKRHATCEHHLRAHHPDPKDRARVLRRAARRAAREQERARSEEARAAIADLEGSLQTTQAAADPQDDDSLRKKRRRSDRSYRFWTLEKAPQIRPTPDFLAMLRARVEIGIARSSSSSEILPHFGSGPCHAIPRPREGTPTPPPSHDGRLA